MSINAFCYTRVSSVGQVDGDGLTRQIEACRKYADSNGIKIIRIFEERGVSGTAENRAELARLMVALETNGHSAKTVLIEKLDRLSRDLMVQERLISNLKEGGFDLVSVAEGSDLLSDDPTRKFIRQIFGAVAEFDKSMLVLKLKVARDRKRANTGRCEGRRGYGDQPDLIFKIVQMREKDGMTYGGIADWLNKVIESKTLSGCAWTERNVWKVYQTYKGRVA